MSDARRPLGPDDVPALLKQLERPRAPEDMLAKVRARLLAEPASDAELPSFADPLAEEPLPQEPLLEEPLPAPVSLADEAKKRPWRKWGVEGLAVAAAVAALVVAVQVGEQIPQAGNPAAEAAGFGAEDPTVVDVRLAARGLDAVLVQRLATSAGLAREDGAEGPSYAGGAHDVRRFLVSLRVEAARAGIEVSGFIPEAGQLRVTVVTD